MPNVIPRTVTDVYPTRLDVKGMHIPAICSIETPRRKDEGILSRALTCREALHDDEIAALDGMAADKQWKAIIAVGDNIHTFTHFEPTFPAFADALIDLFAAYPNNIALSAERPTLWMTHVAFRKFVMSIDSRFSFGSDTRELGSFFGDFPLTESYFTINGYRLNVVPNDFAYQAQLTPELFIDAQDKVWDIRKKS